MELTLTPDLEAMIARRLETGRYQNAEQVVLEALKATLAVDEQRNAALDALRHMIDDDADKSASARDWLRRSSEESRSGV